MIAAGHCFEDSYAGPDSSVGSVQDLRTGVAGLIPK